MLFLPTESPSSGVVIVTLNFLFVVVCVMVFASRLLGRRKLETVKITNKVRKVVFISAPVVEILYVFDNTTNNDDNHTKLITIFKQ